MTLIDVLNNKTKATRKPLKLKIALTKQVARKKCANLDRFLSAETALVFVIWEILWNLF